MKMNIHDLRLLLSRRQKEGRGAVHWYFWCILAFLLRINVIYDFRETDFVPLLHHHRFRNGKTYAILRHNIKYSEKIGNKARMYLAYRNECKSKTQYHLLIDTWER